MPLLRMSHKYSKRICIGLAASMALGSCAISFKKKDDAHSRALAAQDEGSTGAMHDAHLDTIVFAKSEIPHDGNASVPLETTFRADETIWNRYYLSASVAKRVATQKDPRHRCNREYGRQLDVFAKVGSLDELHYRVTFVNDKTWGYSTSAQINPDNSPLMPQDTLTLPHDRAKDGVGLLLAFTMLADGSYPVKMRVQATCDGGPQVDLAVGEFTVIVDDKAREALTARLHLAASLYDDASEVTRMQSAATTSFPDRTLLDLRVLESAWSVQRNGLGTPIAREISVLALYQEKESCTLVGSSIREEHQGGGQYGEPILFHSRDDRLREVNVPCGISAQPNQ